MAQITDNWLKSLEDEIVALRAENDQLMVVLDAAKQDLATISDQYQICYACKHGNDVNACEKYDCSKKTTTNGAALTSRT